MPDTNAIQHFSDLELPDAVLRAIKSVGYETPTPIQSRTIPPLLTGRHLLGHAPTGTGKTAAFALPILARLDLDARGVQALVLTPTRELAIQVAEAFTKYAAFMRNLRVLPIYGGQDYTGQIRQLGRGVNIVVGTPGRIMDHMRRGTLTLNNLQTLVLDEADEMLRMGFIDDVEWILEQTPATRQMALFSATMPSVIRRIAAKHLTDPVEITIEGKTTTAATIRQRFWLVSGLHKLDALTRILEAESFDAMLVFVRTRTATAELAEKLSARGFAAAAMNGDMPQKQREQMVEKLKRGQLDILVATDVVARGLDVDRISHVINYDIPYDTEAYVHRIGRTGRAGRAGDAILFVTQRERRLLGSIEKATRQKIEPLQLPTIEMVNNKRIADFKQRISDTLGTGELAWLQRLVEEFSRDHDVPPERVAAALAKMTLGDQPLVIGGREDYATRDKRKGKDREKSRDKDPSRVEKYDAEKRKKPDSEFAKDKPVKKRNTERDNTETRKRTVEYDKEKPSSPTTEQPGKIDQQSADKIVEDVTLQNRAPDSQTRQVDESTDDGTVHTASSRATRRRAAIEAELEMERFRVEVGDAHGAKAENLVGAIANEAGLDAEFIGRVTIHDEHSIVELPAGMPKFLLKDLKRVWVCNRKLDISRLSDKRFDGSAPGAGTGNHDSQTKPHRTGREQTTAKRSERSSKGRSHKSGKHATAGSAVKHEAKRRTSDPHSDQLKADVKREAKKKQRHRNKKNKGKPG